jgi:hypothetical protein
VIVDDHMMVIKVIEYLYKVKVTYFQVMKDKLVNKPVKIQLYLKLLMVKTHLELLVSFVVLLMTNVMVLLIIDQSKVFHFHVYHVVHILFLHHL